MEGRNNSAVKPAPNPPVIRTASETREFVCFDAAVGSNKPLQCTMFFRSILKGGPRFPCAFKKALALLQKIFKKYFEQQDEVISGYGVRR